MKNAPRPNKALGQHFLVNQGVIEHIASLALSLSPGTPVVEIGPGPGPLTGALLAKAARVRALELDPRMVATLQEKFAPQIASGQLEIIHGDALTQPFEEIFAGATQWTLCGNLPYNVGTQIAIRFLEEAPAAQSFCFMLQKEVVERLRAGWIFPNSGKDYGALSLKLAWSVAAVEHFWVRPGSFSPPPKVDSGVLAYRRLPQPQANPLERRGFYDHAAALAAQAFGQRRKMLRSTLPQLKGTRWQELRPEAISPAEWLEIAAKNG